MFDSILYFYVYLPITSSTVLKQFHGCQSSSQIECMLTNFIEQYETIIVLFIYNWEKYLWKLKTENKFSNKNVIMLNKTLLFKEI